jgi:peroxiredoxin Q/BCP
MLEAGDIAPDFELQDDEGKPVKLSDYRGRKVALYFYPEDFTTG